MPDALGRAPSLVILGTDALIAARPATPVQLAHACLALGFDGVVPASWGDELVADAAMRRLADGHAGPAVLCTCPQVTRRVLGSGDELLPYVVSLVSPPVAAARYLRTLWEPRPIRLSFVGRCCGADDVSIDERYSPRELLVAIAAAGIVLADQPQVWEEVIPPDRRRFHSLPGGMPAADRLRERCGRTLVELDGRDFAMELAQALLASEDVVIDASAALGCSCARGGCMSRQEVRDALAVIEPPRSHAPVLIETRTPLALDLPLAARETAETPHIVSAPSAPADTGAQQGAAEGEKTMRGEPPRRSDSPIVPSADAPTAANEVPFRPTPRSFVVRRRPGERPRHPALTTFDRRTVGIAPLIANDAGAAAPTETTEPQLADTTIVDAKVADATDADTRRTESDMSTKPTPDTEPTSQAMDAAPEPSEMDRLRDTAARALAPFIANVQAMGDLASASEETPHAAPRPRPAPLADEPPRATDVPAPIVVAREPDVAARTLAADMAPPIIEDEPMDTVVEPLRTESPRRRDSVPLREPEAPETPTIKSVAAASRASGAHGAPRRDSFPTPPEVNATRNVIITPPHKPHQRRTLTVSLGIVLLAAAALAAYTGMAGRAVATLTGLTR